MRILFLHQYFCPSSGWGNDRSRALMAHWAAAGHQVACITSTAYLPPPYRPPRAEWQLHEGITVRVLPIAYRQQMSRWAKARSFMRFGLAALQEALAQDKPDVIIASVTPPTVGYAGYLASKLHGVPLVLEVVDVWPDVPQGMGILRNQLLLSVLHGLNAIVYTHAAHIVALSPGMRAQVGAHGVPLDKITVSYNGTDTAQFFPVSGASRAAGEPVRLIYAGALGQANDLGRVLRLMPALNARLATPVRLDIYGWGQEAALLSALVCTLGLSNVHLHPPVPKAELNALLNTADIALCTFASYPVLEANSANKFYDYLAAGLPVVLNYQGWQADYLAAHACGLSAPMEDDEAWMNAIVRLAEDPGLRAAMSRNARELAVSRFDRKQLAQDYLALLAGL
ncbi:MAG: glycosyltransferase family 4 protein [Bacteroidetes bacterium]|nr:glycosyltransferase family 4 protein [Bacteroidota bacterium]